MDRSPTAERVFQEMARAKGVNVQTLSAGLSDWAVNPLTTDLVEKADLIFVMEDYMKHEIESGFSVDPGRIIVLGIPDTYYRNDPVLVKILRDALEPYL